MRVHFIDNFMTLTISSCNSIFKMAPCLQVGESRAEMSFYSLLLKRLSPNNGTE